LENGEQRPAPQSNQSRAESRILPPQRASAVSPIRFPTFPRVITIFGRPGGGDPALFERLSCWSQARPAHDAGRA
jgi:hypothetical protein